MPNPFILKDSPDEGISQNKNHTRAKTNSDYYRRLALHNSFEEQIRSREDVRLEKQLELKKQLELEDQSRLQEQLELKQQSRLQEQYKNFLIERIKEKGKAEGPLGGLLLILDQIQQLTRSNDALLYPVAYTQLLHYAEVFCQKEINTIFRLPSNYIEMIVSYLLANAPYIFHERIKQQLELKNIINCIGMTNADVAYDKDKLNLIFLIHNEGIANGVRFQVLAARKLIAYLVPFFIEKYKDLPDLNTVIDCCNAYLQVYETNQYSSLTEIGQVIRTRLQEIKSWAELKIAAAIEIQQDSCRGSFFKQSDASVVLDVAPNAFGQEDRLEISNMNSALQSSRA